MRIEEVAYRHGYRITERGMLLNKQGQIVSGVIDDGYKRTCIRISGKKIQLRFHRLQAFQKYGEAIYKEGVLVRHHNGIRLDNSHENILIGTQTDNAMDIPEAIRLAHSLHAASFQKKYDNDEVKTFYENNGRSYKKTMNQFGISSKGTLNYILKGRKRIKNTTLNQF